MISYLLIKDFNKKGKPCGYYRYRYFKINDEYISEVNPRFGGYPHAHEGMNVPRMIVNNINQKLNEDIIGQYKEAYF